MARIVPIQPKITLHQSPDAAGKFYPACIFSNDTFVSMFENSLIVAKDLIDPENIERATIENILTGLSDYRIWKADKKVPEFPTEITEHFNLLPGKECSFEMPFKALNNLPTEAFLYTHDEVLSIVVAFKMALEKADAEQTEIIQPLYDSFNRFLTDWEANQQVTGSYFANEQNV